jgi:ABC-type uncharacterized transport system ATPase subunit
MHLDQKKLNKVAKSTERKIRYIGSVLHDPESVVFPPRWSFAGRK